MKKGQKAKKTLKKQKGYIPDVCGGCGVTLWTYGHKRSVAMWCPSCGTIWQEGGWTTPTYRDMKMVDCTKKAEPECTCTWKRTLDAEKVDAHMMLKVVRTMSFLDKFIYF